MDLVEDSETLDSYLRGIIGEKYRPTRLDLVKICTKISFRLLSSNSKIMRTFALGLLAFRSICRS